MKISRGGVAVVAGSAAAVLLPPLWFNIRGAPAKPSESEEPTWADLDWDEPLASPEMDARVARYFFVGYGAISAMALASGVAFGIKNFDTSAALEALEKEGGKKPTVEAEALAMRTAAKALGWGTVLSFGAAIASVLTVKYVIGFETVAEFGRGCDRALQPVNKSLQARGRWLHAKVGTFEASGRSLGRWLGAPEYEEDGNVVGREE
jgi:hypothetical protein